MDAKRWIFLIVSTCTHILTPKPYSLPCSSVHIYYKYYIQKLIFIYILIFLKRVPFIYRNNHIYFLIIKLFIVSFTSLLHHDSLMIPIY